MKPVFLNPELSQWLAPAQVLSGIGSAGELLALLKSRHKGARLACVVGKGLRRRGGWLVEVLQSLAAELDLHWVEIGCEPTVALIDAYRAELGEAGEVAAVLSIGGGSVLDAGKALAALLTESGSAESYLEGVGTQSPSGTLLPWYAIPTTGGTGSEASTNAVLSNKQGICYKRSLRHPNYRPVAVALDGNLCDGLSRTQLAASGMDAFTQLLESYLSAKADPLLLDLLQTAIERCAQVLHTLATEKRPHTAEEGQVLLESACVSGIGLSRAGLGTVHGFAGPLGALSELPHGLICARMLGPVLEASVQQLAIQCSDGEPEALVAEQKLARLFKRKAPGGHPFAGLEVLEWVEQVKSWADAFELPALSSGWPDGLDPEVILKQTSNRENPARLSTAVLRTLLAQALLSI